MPELLSYLPLPQKLLNSNGPALLEVDRSSGKISTRQFTGINSLLKQGDLLVFNNSAVVRASVPVYFPGQKEYGKLHIGTSTSNSRLRIVEVRPRRLNEAISENSEIIISGTPEKVMLVRRHNVFERFFWAETESGRDLLEVANENGTFIRYDHVPFDLPENFYETEFSRIPGSVEFPSASRAFNSTILQESRNKGIETAEITLHCNLGSLEPFEFMDKHILLDEQYFISKAVADKISRTKVEGGRVIAVGTSAVRALESASLHGRLRSGQKNTEIFIEGDFKFRTVDAMITGLHEPDGSHISMISSFAGSEKLLEAYSIAQNKHLFWHEFGDLAFIH